MGNVVRRVFVRARGPEQTDKGPCFAQLERQNSLVKSLYLILSPFVFS